MTATAIQNRFSYAARDQNGQPISGVVTALTQHEATRMLRSEGKYILDIKPCRISQETLTAPTIGSSTGRVSKDEVINFTLQLSVMVDTGVPLSDALTALAEQSSSPNFTAVVRQILSDVQSGKDFSSSLERYPKIFPRYYVSLVKASEVSGTMGRMLRRLSDYLISQREIVKKVRGAMIYPAFMFVMCISTTIFLLTQVLPKFTAIFASRKAALPVPTQILISVSHSLTDYWFGWVGGTLAAAALIIWFLSTRTGRRAFDWLKLNVPIFGGMFHKLYLSRSLQTLSTMLDSGVQVLDSLAIVRDVAGNSYYAELWDDIRKKIQTGQQFSDPLLRSKLVPRSISQMIASGEKTGELPSVMARVSGFLEEDLRNAIKTATQFIEPVMIGIMGLIIGGVAIAMLLPILTISRVMASG